MFITFWNFTMNIGVYNFCVHIYVPFFLFCSYIFSIHTVSLLFGATLKNFIYKHTLQLKNVQRNKKKGKLSWPQKSTTCNTVGWPWWWEVCPERVKVGKSLVCQGTHYEGAKTEAAHKDNHKLLHIHALSSLNWHTFPSRAIDPHASILLN